MKNYMIVTNDRYEHPVAHDLSGAQSVADYLGLSVNRVRKNICSGRWNHRQKYKAVIDESGATDAIELRREYARHYRFTHDRSSYFRDYYRKRKEGAVHADSGKK